MLFFFFLATVCVCVLRDGFCESMSFLTSFFFPLVFSVHVRAVQLIVHRRLNSDTELKSPKALSHEKKKKKTVMSAKERCREREKRREKKVNCGVFRGGMDMFRHARLSLCVYSLLILLLAGVQVHI